MIMVADTFQNQILEMVTFCYTYVYGKFHLSKKSLKSNEAVSLEGSS